MREEGAATGGAACVAKQHSKTEKRVCVCALGSSSGYKSSNALTALKRSLHTNTHAPAVVCPSVLSDISSSAKVPSMAPVAISE